MPVDRDATLKLAEKLLRQGRLDGAIAEYVRLVQDHPRDWNSINTLGDLYVRAGDCDRAVEQFIRIADHMVAEGFLPKAAALYKKALRTKPDHDHTLVQLAELAGRQGLLVDARQYLKQLGRLRRDRGDERGSADVLVRMALLDEADADTQLAGARAAQTLGETARAVELYRLAAAALIGAGRRREAGEALAAAASLDPADADLRRELASVSSLSGGAGDDIAGESPDSNPDFLFALGRSELAAGHESDARMAFTRLMTLAPGRSVALQGLAEELAAAGSLAQAFICTEVLVDDAALAEDWDRAVASLESLLRHGAYVPALVKLVELAVDGGRDEVIESAQARLADAYIESGRADEARAIAEDLVARRPQSAQHVERLRRALHLLGIEDVDAIVERYREPVDKLGDDFDLEDGTAVETEDGIAVEIRVEDVAPGPDGERTGGLTAAERPPVAGVPQADAVSFDPDAVEDDDGEAIVLDTLEIDLSGTLADLGGAGGERSSPSADLDAVFDDMRKRVVRAQSGGDGSAEYERGLRRIEQGRLAEAAASLRAAARMPLYRFLASARLGRLCLARGDTAEGIEWLERAAEAPAPTADEGWSLLYDLADALERIGEKERALAVLLELEADAGAYRDVRQRIDLLSRAQAEPR